MPIILRLLTGSHRGAALAVWELHGDRLRGQAGVFRIAQLRGAPESAEWQAGRVQRDECLDGFGPVPAGKYLQPCHRDYILYKVRLLWDQWDVCIASACIWLTSDCKGGILSLVPHDSKQTGNVPVHRLWDMCAVLPESSPCHVETPCWWAWAAQANRAWLALPPSSVDMR